MKRKEPLKLIPLEDLKKSLAEIVPSVEPKQKFESSQAKAKRGKTSASMKQ